MNTIGQRRANFALDRILTTPPELKDDMKTFSAGAPSMILQNGFGHTLAFWLAKGTLKHLQLFDIVKKWLVMNELASGNDRGEFMRNLTEMDWKQYIKAQKEALALLEWVKRFAKAGL